MSTRQQKALIVRWRIIVSFLVFLAACIKRLQLRARLRNVPATGNFTAVSVQTPHVSESNARSAQTAQIFVAVTMKNTVFWDVTQRDSCKKQRFGGTYRLHHQGNKNR
jgi:hypothetical protein